MRPGRHPYFRTIFLCALTALFAAAGGYGLCASSDVAFIDQINVAMSKMMDGMHVRPSGDVDKDFVNVMVPHHEGGIEMAEAELRYGRNVPLRRIAQEIIVTQQQEIAAMRLAAGEPLPPSAPAPDQTPKQ
jgi:hypothetical protein